MSDGLLRLTSLPPENYKLLPLLQAPAGYLCLIRDMEYGDSYFLIILHDAAEIDDSLNVEFETRLERIFGVEDDAESVKQALLQYLSREDGWFTLSPDQLRDIDRLASPPRRRPAMPPQNPGRRRGAINAILIALILVVIGILVEQSNGAISGMLGRFTAPAATATARPSPTGTATSTPSNSPVPSDTATATDAPTNTPSPTDTATATDAPTNTAVPSETATATDAPTNTAIPTDTPTATAMPSNSPAPTDTPTATDTPTDLPPQIFLVETAGSLNANIRSCPRTSCDIVAKFAPGAEVIVIGRAEGETVYGTDVWLEIKLEAGSAYLHSELAEPTE